MVRDYRLNMTEHKEEKDTEILLRYMHIVLHTFKIDGARLLSRSFVLHAVTSR